MKKSSLYVITLLTLLVSFLIVGCNEQTDDIPTGDVVALTDYTIMRSDTISENVPCATALRSLIEEKCGFTISIGTDFVTRGSEIPTDTLEIVVGKTNRHEVDTLKASDWSVSREGNRVYLLGITKESVMNAVDFFAEHFLTSGGMNIVDGYHYENIVDYAVKTVTLGSKTLSDIAVYDSTGLADRFVSDCTETLTEKTGMICTKGASEASADIVYSVRNDVGIPANSWGVSVRDGKIYVIGATQKLLNRSAKYLQNLLAKADGDFTLKEGVVYSETVQSKEEFMAQKQLVIYPEFPEQVNRNYDYDVSVTMDGKTYSLPVYNHVMQNNIKSRSLGGDLYRRFSTFAFSSGTVRVDIKVKKDFNTYLVGPSGKQFRHDFKDGVISVYLDEPNYFYVMLDNDLNSMISIFADEPEYPEDIPDEDDENVLYVHSGEWYEPEGGITHIKQSGYTIYVAPGGVLNSRVKIEGSNCRVYGHGAMVDPFENLYEYDISVGGSETKGYYFFHMWGTNNVLDGLHLLDSRSYNCCFGGTGSVVRNLKAMSTMLTSDGIMIGGTAEHCFLYVGDNSIDWSGDNIHVRDITIGTTCKALFPQTNSSTSSQNSLLEDLYVFRIGEEVISNNWNPKKLNMTTSFTVRNLDCTDCTYVPFLFTGRNMGTNPKNIVLENVSLPSILGAADPHITNTAAEKRYHLRFYNVEGTDMDTSNYTLTLKNLAVGGKVLDESELLVLGKEFGATITVTSDSGYTPTVRNEKTVNWKAPNKVFVGKLQITFASPVIAEGSDFLLPLEAMKSAIRNDTLTADTEKDGISYIKSTSLISKKSVKSVEIKDGTLYIEPNDNGENLLVADSGEISYFSEAVCYKVDLILTEEDGRTVYNLKNITAANAGLTRLITDDVKMYGAGKYTLTFDAKGETADTLHVTQLTETASNKKSLSVSTNWKSFTFTFEVTEADIENGMTALSVTAATENLKSFAVRDIKLVKNS